MRPQVAVAGYVCLDIIPTFTEQKERLDLLFQPGKLLTVGTAVTAPGGVVSNTGLALHRLGVPVKLVGKVGRDLFGQALLRQYRQYDEALAAGMIVSDEEATSYTIVISPPGVDRFFLHYPGANNSFSASDVALQDLAGVQIFHFGYPPLMRRMYEEGGAELALLLQRVKAAGLTTSLDMTIPDPSSDGARVDWEKLLKGVLPSVDIFLPSLDEVLFMLKLPQSAVLGQEGSAGRTIDGRFLKQAAGQMLEMGAALVAIKLGDQGLYLRTTADKKRLLDMGAAAPADITGWLGRELLAPCFRVDVVGTTGAGDCAIAGFLTGLLKGLPAAAALTASAAVGACNVEGADATSSIPDWQSVQARIAAGWTQHKPALSLAGWQQKGLIWTGPDDQKV